MSKETNDTNMSNASRSKVLTWVTDNIVVAVIGLILGSIAWANNKQLAEVRLNQENAFLRNQNEMNDKFVTKTWFIQEDTNLKAADIANAQAQQTIAASVNKIETAIAVLTSEVRNQTHTSKN